MSSSGSIESPRAFDALASVISRAEDVEDPNSERFRSAVSRVRLRQLGTLVIHIKNGEGLPRQDSLFAAVRVPMADGESKRYRTATRPGPSPDWDQFLPVDGRLGDMVSQPLRVEVFEERGIGQDGKEKYRKIGHVELPVSGLSSSPKLLYDGLMLESSQNTAIGAAVIRRCINTACVFSTRRTL